MEVEEHDRPRYLPGHSQSVLPPLGTLRMDRKVETDGRQQPRYPSMSESSISASQLPSPSSNSQSGPVTSYSYASSATMASVGSGYLSPPASRRPTEEKPDFAGPRQSLPSIHEALSNNPLPYSATAQNSTPLAEQPSVPLSAPPLPSPAPRPFIGGPQGPPNPFAQPQTPATPREQQLPPPSNPLPSHHQTESRRSGSFSAINGTDSRPRPIQTYGLPRSPRAAQSATFAPAAGRSPISGSGLGSAKTTSPTTYGGPFRSPYPHSAHSSHPSASLGGSEETGRPFATNWKLDNPPKYASTQPSAQGHTETVKRHLDIYDSELAMNEVLECSSRLHEFSRHFAAQLHQNQRAEVTLETLPSVQQVDDMKRQAQCLHAGLDRIKNTVVYQQQVLADERRAAHQNKAYQDEMNGYPEDFKGPFSAGDAKKRRGKAAPPGRCHSCNRAETPEWRRGPDGARTLCNACGLHYAKLTRKNGVNKAASIGSSNLRPKNEFQ